MIKKGNIIYYYKSDIGFPNIAMVIKEDLSYYPAYLKKFAPVKDFAKKLTIK